MNQRVEKDTMGKMSIPDDKLWGVQTQRSLENFKIGSDNMPLRVIYALALIKECAAQTNESLGFLSSKKSKYIVEAAQEIQKGKWDEHFPLSVWQTGSGTQTNMNVNEVIANRAIQLSGGKLGDGSFHPNDDVNKSQSSNDTFPSAMRIASLLAIHNCLIPALTEFEKVLSQQVKSFENFIKIGRTHLMDAVPLSVGQEFSAFKEQIHLSKKRIESSLTDLLSLPLGGTAVGTGLNTAPGFSSKACELISAKVSHDFKPASNKFEGIASHDSLVQVSGSLKSLAVSLMKIGNDIRLLASGPRCGLSELILPANEPGSSIMPGKINPTQCEALTMLCAQVIGQDLSVSLGGSMGQLQLNTFKPLIIFNTLRSIQLLSDGMDNFRKKCLQGITVNEKRIEQLLENSLMLVTALNPHIGYEKSAQIAKAAYKNGTTLKQEALKSGFLTEKQFDAWLCPKDMIKPNLKPSS